MKPILPFLFVILSTGAAQADNLKVCSTLENSYLSPNSDSSIAASSNVAFSSDRKQIALYQVAESKKQATFKLFDSKTGKLLQQKILKNYEERSLQAQLNFSPQDRIVYLQGMSYSTQSGDNYGAIPFWNLANNQIIFSPCSTAMGVREVQFSDDETVAFSRTADSFSSLCSTQEEKAIALIGQSHDYIFNPKTKHLYADHVDTNYQKYQSLVERLGADIKHVTLYKSPVPEHPYREGSRNTFVSTLLGTVPNHRQIIAKSEGSRLSLSYWDHAVEQNPPKKIYQHDFTISELNREKIIVPFFHSRLSPDENQAAFISKTGVILVFNIETGELHWKKNLPATTSGKGTPSYNLQDNFLAEHGASATALVFKNQADNTVDLYDWQNGKQSQLDIPDAYHLSYEQYGQYLVFEAKQEDAQSLLLVNWQTGRKQTIKLPDGFRYYASDQFFTANSQQLVLKERTPAESILVLSLSSGKYQSLKAPYPSARYYSSEYIRLGDKHYRVSNTVKPNGGGKEQTYIELYDVASKRSLPLQTADVFLYRQLVEGAGGASEYHTVSYDQQAKQTSFCRWPLMKVVR